MIKQQIAAWAKHMVEANCLILDTETTGIGSDAQIVEIAIIDCAGTVLLNTLVKPTCPIPAAAIALHGITDEQVKDAPTFYEVWGKARALLADRTVLVYNVDFDLRLLNQSMKACNIRGESLATDNWYCLMKACTDYFQRRKFVSLDSAHARLNWDEWEQIAQGQKHRALADCHTALLVLKALAERANEPTDW